ncbi:Peptidase C19, ubiquitin carboxyl-terminal hydrolase 2 domain-containing protein [Rozella allomycis CSF55]|uniref:ubiquitinyl hydrolase 1 n=1 Tax=Rozella allomycis (strain CSF55) TaxID=988480 RepID=A0A075AXT4_ROZAC|nr:Peptidase C19, ubiquitin carboxyl-terminal hydrolase 2 domain-containing protein [Rozella allomycis CSF55]|eukprot:EPZ34964.1 Peptidase C19, ubiquitin carboxyl-terminal hydrolase 2 domain-containing protein [Rozella allomycis CSF55]
MGLFSALTSVLTSSSKSISSTGNTDPNLESRFFGLSNFGNTCYCNSVIQALFHCKDFRNSLIDTLAAETKSLPTTPLSPFEQEKAFTSHFNDSQPNLRGIKEQNDEEKSLFYALRDLFIKLRAQKKQTGYLQPKKLILSIKQKNEIFQNSAQHDAHELLNFVLNTIDEEMKEKSCVKELFKGTLANETRCCNCETITRREEDFIDLSLEIEQNVSISNCMAKFSAKELLAGKNKFFCDVCQSYQEAEKRMLIKNLPKIQIIQLKRFKYVERVQRLIKLSHRVAFPFEIQFNNTTLDCEHRFKNYSLFAVVVHIGSGMAQGHYVTLIRHEDKWICFDDDRVIVTNDQYVEHVFGQAIDGQTSISETGYILFYERIEE